jgi:hypothetical protein
VFLNEFFRRVYCLSNSGARLIDDIAGNATDTLHQ